MDFRRNHTAQPADLPSEASAVRLRERHETPNTVPKFQREPLWQGLTAHAARFRGAVDHQSPVPDGLLMDAEVGGELAHRQGAVGSSCRMPPLCLAALRPLGLVVQQLLGWLGVPHRHLDGRVT